MPKPRSLASRLTSLSDGNHPHMEPLKQLRDDAAAMLLGLRERVDELETALDELDECVDGLLSEETPAGERGDMWEGARTSADSAVRAIRSVQAKASEVPDDVFEKQERDAWQQRERAAYTP